MFRSKSKERKIFTSRKRVRRHFSGLAAITTVALFLLVLELLTRIFIDLSGNRSKYAQATSGSDLSQAYRLKVTTNKSKTDSKFSDRLTVKPALSVGYELLGNQKSKYWQINEQGWRDFDAISVAKPKDEIRIFVLGGSTAFGYGNLGNDATISEQLEKRLAKRLAQQKASPQLYQPDLLPLDEVERKKYLAKPPKIKPGNYRVINAAVPGYASGNELAQLALKILKYKPDLIVVLNGYEDLMLPSSELATQVLKLEQLEAEQEGLVGYISQVIKPLENKSYLAKIAQNNWLNPQAKEEKTDFVLNEETTKLVEHLPSDDAELKARVARYTDNQKQILNLSAAARVPLVVAMQPEITGRNPSQLTDSEGQIATELGRTYIKKMRAEYPALIKASQKLAQSFPSNMKAIDLYKLTDQYPSPSFIDAIHLNKAANEKAAEQLYYAISSFSKMQVVPQQAQILKPLSLPNKYQR